MDYRSGFSALPARSGLEGLRACTSPGDLYSGFPTERMGAWDSF